MKKIIVSLTLLIFLSLTATADLIVTNYTPRQYNIQLSNGMMFGISATSPSTTTFTDSTINGMTISFARINPGALPWLYVGDATSGFPLSAPYSSVAPVTATPFTAYYFETPDHVYINIFP